MQTRQCVFGDGDAVPVGCHYLTLRITHDGVIKRPTAKPRGPEHEQPIPFIRYRRDLLFGDGINLDRGGRVRHCDRVARKGWGGSAKVQKNSGGSRTRSLSGH